MNQVEFEKLSRTLLIIIPKINSRGSLLELASKVLGAEAAFLFERQTLNDMMEPVLIQIWPQEYLGQLTPNFDDLRSWYKNCLSLWPIEGFSKEAPIEWERVVFPDAMVVFGELLSSNLPRYEMILLKRLGSGEFYRSYHCWAGAQMIRQFEFHDLQNETRIKDQYALSLSEDVLFDEGWAGLRRRMEDKFPSVRWKAYTEWFAYQVRKKSSDLPSKTEVEAAFNKEGKAPDSVFREVILFLGGAVLAGYEGSFKNLQEVLLTRSQATGSEMNPICWHQLKALVLEQAWERIRQNVSNQTAGFKHRSPASPELAIETLLSTDPLEGMEPIRELLKLTRGFIIQILDSGDLKMTGVPDYGANSPSGLQELGRDFLRLYLATEIAKPSSRIEQLYLGGQKRDEARTAPLELRRNFALNLSRFMLSVVEILQRKLHISTRQWPITSAEALDSLLYLVDRYAHVELEVDERLDIRRHLARQFPFEVHHQLSHPFYRDHLLHAIDVFILGHLLLSTNVCWIDNSTCSLARHLTMLPCSDGAEKGRQRSEKGWLQNWAVASLFHDIGYQLGQGRTISHDPEIWTKYFELSGPDNAEWLTFPRDRVEGQGSMNRETALKFVESLATEICECSRPSGFLPKVSNEKRGDHGVLSALRVLQILLHGDYQHKIPESRDAGELVFRYSHAVHAIAYHNLFSHQVSFESYPLSCILRICDELQEWDRRRVNIEKVVKQLYLDIQQGDLGEFPSYETIGSCHANLRFRKVEKDGVPELEVALQDEKKPWYHFILLYRDSMEANFDPIMTLLNKAYNLQNIDLAITTIGPSDKNLTVSMALQFPRPTEYGNLTEYDIYGLFTEEIRSMPLLPQFSDITDAESGLLRLKGHSDTFVIRLSRKADTRHRHGWLPVDPSYFFDRFMKFKGEVLAKSRHTI